MSPQAETILKHLLSYGSITNVEAQVVYKARSLSRRITEVHRAGYTVQKFYRKDATGQRYVKYVLAQQQALPAPAQSSYPCHGLA